MAGPLATSILGWFGAEVIKVEPPGAGDPIRTWRVLEDGTSLWFRSLARNKKLVAIDLKTSEGQALVRRLALECDVLVENFRPGTLERWGLDPEELRAEKPELIVARVSGFGQTGPYRQRPGFATIAESMSGLAAISGEPGGQPLLPPIALTDELTGLAAAFATLVAVHSGVGQVVDVTLIESLFQFMSPLVTLYGLTGELQGRLGAGLPYTVPRGTYQCSDGAWVGLSASSDSVAARLLNLLGVGDDPRFATFVSRMEHREELEGIMRDWCAVRTRDEVLAAFAEAEAAVGPVMDIADITADPHYQAREAIVELDGTPMQGLIAKLSATPGRLQWQGRAMDADGAEIREKGWDR